MGLCEVPNSMMIYFIECRIETKKQEYQLHYLGFQGTDTKVGRHNPLVATKQRIHELCFPVDLHRKVLTLMIVVDK